MTHTPRTLLLRAASSALLPITLMAGACGGADEVTSSGGGPPETLLTGAGGGAVASSSSATSSTSSASISGAGGSGGSVGLGAPYPIVLAHGFFGFNDFAGAGFETYFFKIKQHFADKRIEIYTPAVDPFNGSDVRGAELTAIIEQIVAETGRAKVNIIGHSQGGLDARVVAHDRPDLVASVMTVATPHHGTPVADIALQLLADPSYESVLDALVNAIGAPLYDQLGNESSTTAALHLFSQPGILAFNAHYKDSPGVRYWSVTGRTAFSAGGDDCAPDVDVPFVNDFGGERDPVDILFSPTQALLAGPLFDPIPNDGLVRARDARWGTFLGCVPADHMDEVGQILGDGPGLGNAWDYVDLYDALVDYVRAQGL